MASTMFHEFYKSDLQAVYALCVVPLVFLAWLLFSPAARTAAAAAPSWQKFLYAYCVVFAVETIVDPIATGPLTRWLGVSDSSLGTAILLTFVLLGDFRVYLLIFRFAALERPLHRILLKAAAWTFVVPIVAYLVDSALHRARPSLPDQSIWLVYELAFLSIAIWLAASFIPRHVREGALRRPLQAAARYVAVYYALWATADVVIMAAGLDVGWALRVIPNQLYYSFYLPYVYFQFSSRR